MTGPKAIALLVLQLRLDIRAELPQALELVLVHGHADVAHDALAHLAAVAHRLDQLDRVERWEHTDWLDRHRKKISAASPLMRGRAGLVEHPFGTIKRWAGIDHFLMRGRVQVPYGDCNHLIY